VKRYWHHASALIRGLAARIKGSGAVGVLMHDIAYECVMGVRVALGRLRGARGQIRHDYRRVFGRDPDLERPRSFNEKTQYLKLHDVTDRHRLCADKLAVRDYVVRHVPEDVLVPLRHVFDSADSVRPENIPERSFAIKATHDSGSTQLCLDRDTFQWAHCRRRLHGALSRDFSFLHGELQYRGIPRRIIVEDLLPEALFIDYKIFCFGGEPHFIGVNYDRRGNHRHDFFDLDWKRLPVVYAKPTIGHSVPPPKTLATMIEYARRLASPFKFVRIDFYESDGKLFFSEITFHQYSGLMNFEPESFDLELGALIRL